MCRFHRRDSDLSRHLDTRPMSHGASPPAFLAPKCKNPRLSGGGSWLREPDDYLLSHGNPHYHRRRVVSRSCSGWEGVGPTRYGHQAKGVVALLRSATNLGRSSNFELCVSHTRIQHVSSCYAGHRYFNRRAASISFAARRSAWDARKC